MNARLVAAGIVLLLASAALPRVTREMPDFEVYWRAGHRAANAEFLYQPADGHYQNKYLPVFAVAALPLALMPLQTAKIVWFYLTVLAILALLGLSFTLLPDARRPALPLLAMTFTAMLKFYAREVNLGQGNALMAVLVLAALWLMVRGRAGSAGVVAGASIAVKPYTLAFLPYLALRRRWAALAAFVATLTALLLTPAAVYGFAGNLALLSAWMRTTAESTAPNLLNPDNVSIWAMYAKWIGTTAAATALALATIAALGGTFLIVIRGGRKVASPDYLEVATLLLMLPLVSPQGWDYVLLLATPAVMLLLNHFTQLPRSWRVLSGVSLAVMSLTVYDILGRRAYAAFMATSAITVCAMVIIATLFVMRVKRIA